MCSRKQVLYFTVGAMVELCFSWGEEEVLALLVAEWARMEGGWQT